MPKIQAAIAGVYSTHGIMRCDRNHRMLSQETTRLEKASRAVFQPQRALRFTKETIQSFVFHRVLGGLKGLLGRLLLGHAMHSAQAPDEVAGVDRDDFAGREKFGQRVKSGAIVRAVEDWRQDDTVGDVEVGIARR